MAEESLSSRIYTGKVRHRRFLPVRNEFTYRLAPLYLDLDELPRLFDDVPGFAVNRPAVAAFRRKDYACRPGVPLDQVIRDLVEERTGRRPEGPIRLLTHLRYFGYCFNPVSFYYCFDQTGRNLETIVSEVTNTPWKERHSYVHGRADSVGTDRRWRFRFAKDFHVSPFIGMDVDYDWMFSPPGETLNVHMVNLRGGEPFFDATMTLRARPITRRGLHAMLIRHPFMTGQVVFLIYWQALKLWLRKAPFHPHPRLNDAGRG